MTRNGYEDLIFKLSEIVKKILSNYWTKIND